MTGQPYKVTYSRNAYDGRTGKPVTRRLTGSFCQQCGDEWTPGRARTRKVR
jgi:hypothetical protein